MNKLLRPRSWGSDLSSKEDRINNSTDSRLTDASISESNHSTKQSTTNKRKKIVCKTINLLVDSDDSIESIMERIHQQEGIPCHRQILRYDNQILQQQLTISDYQISKGATIKLRLQ